MIFFNYCKVKSEHSDEYLIQFKDAHHPEPGEPTFSLKSRLGYPKARLSEGLGKNTSDNRVTKEFFFSLSNF